MKDNPPSSFGTTISTTLLELQRVKYSTSDGRNRIGLRELLMEPVQRIPRYTLLFSQMIKQMPSHDPQRAKLIEAREYASKIAHADLDEETKRAATMYCLKASIEDFPASLWSSSRKFIDCIDVVDILQVGALEGPSTPGGSAGALLHCTLILFDDKLLIAKRVNTEKPSRQLLGLDDLDKVATQVKALSSGSKKHGMAYRGVVEVTDLACTDNGGAGAFINVHTNKDSIYSCICLNTHRAASLPRESTCRPNRHVGSKTISPTYRRSATCHGQSRSYTSRRR